MSVIIKNKAIDYDNLKNKYIEQSIIIKELQELVQSYEYKLDNDKKEYDLQIIDLQKQIYENSIFNYELPQVDYDICYSRIIAIFIIVAFVFIPIL